MMLGRYRDAAEHLWYAKENSSGDIRINAERFLLDAQKSIGTIRVTVNVPDADVLLDGTGVGISPLADPVFVDPGSRVFVARVAGRTAEKKLEVAPGSQHTVELVIEQETKTRPGPDVRPPPSPNRLPVPLLIGGGAVVVVGLGLGIGFSVVAIGDRDTAVAIDARLPGDSTCFGKPVIGDCKALRDAVEGRDRSTNVATASFAAAGVVGVGTGIIASLLLWTKAKDENKGSSGRVTPWIGPHGAGLAGTF